MNAEDARLFVAASVPEAVRGAFEGLRGDLDRRLPSARWVRAEGMHLTFKFLGATPRPRIAALGEAVESAASGAAAFHLTTGATGLFGSARHPRVLWLALEGDVEACASLARALDAALASLGYPPEEKPFRPHLTLARFTSERGSPIPDDLRRTAEDALRDLAFPIDALVLFESFLGRGGARYEALRACPLGGAKA